MHAVSEEMGNPFDFFLRGRHVFQERSALTWRFLWFSWCFPDLLTWGAGGAIPPEHPVPVPSPWSVFHPYSCGETPGWAVITGEG